MRCPSRSGVPGSAYTVQQHAQQSRHRARRGADAIRGACVSRALPRSATRGTAAVRRVQDGNTAHTASGYPHDVSFHALLRPSPASNLARCTAPRCAEQHACQSPRRARRACSTMMAAWPCQALGCGARQRDAQGGQQGAIGGLCASPAAEVVLTARPPQ